MAQSRGCLESGLKGVRELRNSPEDAHAPSCEGNDGLVVAFPLASLALVGGSAVVMVGAKADWSKTRLSPLLPPLGRRKNRVRPDCRSTSAVPAAEASASAEQEPGEIARLGDTFLRSAPAPMPGRLRMRAASGWRWSSVSSSRSSSMRRSAWPAPHWQPQ